MTMDRRSLARRIMGAAAAGLLLAIGATGPAAAQRSLEVLAGTDLPGSDYQTLRRVPLSECQNACLADDRCAAFTYNERARWCFLKSEAGERVPYAGATSAIVVDAAPQDTLELPELAFLPADVIPESRRLEALVATARRTATQVSLVTPMAAQALTSNRTAAWLDFARTLLSTEYEDWSDRTEAQTLAGAAAYLGLKYATTVTDQGRSLAVLSAALERQGLFRPAIEASAASLTLALDPAEQARLERLRAEHGFRVLDYSVDAETRTPRMCVQFSEPLEGEAADLERFVSVAEIAAPIVSVADSQLCVEGLEHGERYSVALREGLPSTVGERLASPSNFRVYVRDRSPAARFETNRYVLPASAGGIPVTTVNTAELDIRLYRISDRNLAEVVRRGDFKRQLYPWEVSQVADETGALAFEGKMNVESVRNEEVTTLFPVDAAIRTVEPGVYVLTAVPSEAPDRGEALATQWFVVSDIGLSTFSSGGTVDVFVRSLSTAEPTGGVELQLLARNDEVLATATTDATGHARLVSTRPTDGALTPAVVTARHGEGDYAFLSLLAGAFELTDRGVEGRTAPGPVDAFLATERGVYRGGETVHLTGLVRDDTSVALTLPVTVKLTRPDGVLSRRISARADTAGGFALDMPLTRNASTGTWRVTAHIDPEGPAVGTATFLVEDYVPQRIAVQVSSPAEEAVAGETIAATVQADFLYGAPAANLMIEGGVTVRAADGIDGFDGYAFGLDAEPFTPRTSPLFDLPRTGPTGSADLSIPIPDVSDATQALEARVAVRVREPGGRQVEDTLTLPVLTGNPTIGIRPNFDERVQEGTTATFSVIALDGTRSRVATEAEWTLTRIHRSFQWYRRNDQWFYEAVERLEEVASGAIEIGADAPARIATPVDWGRYRLEVTDASDGSVASSLTFSAGWVSETADAETPDILEVHLDRDTYVPGDLATLRIVPRHAGKALVTVMSNAVRYHTTVDVPAEGATVTIPVEEDWAPGAYVSATLFRPADASTGGRPLPERAIGLAWLDVDTTDRRLEVSVDAPELARGNRIVTVPVAIEGLDPGETAYLTVAAVDVGILNITGHTPPDADGHFLGQRRLGVELRDLYGDLIDTAGATRGRVRSGGDGPASGTEALPPSEEPVALFTGVIATDPDGVARAVFDVPAFDGTLRVMAIAWTDTKVGDGAADMIVRDPVVMAGSLPRFLAPGDATRMRFDLHNVAHAPGDYTLAVTAAGPVALDRPAETITLSADERESIELPLSATGVGEAAIIARLTGPDGLEVTRDYTIVVRPAASEVSKRSLLALAAGEATTLTANLLENFDADAEVTLSVGSGDIDTAGLLAMLDRFPYGCAEQTVSRALPLLYLNEVAAGIGLDADAAIPERIEDSIRRVLAFQSSTGGFGLWSPGYDLWLTAYVMDFLTRAREAGYAVPADAFELGLDRLQSVLSYIGDVSGDRGSEIAYATYVLARNGRASIGDLRYLAEEQLADFATPLARAQLAASLAFTGDARLADTLFRGITVTQTDDLWWRTDFGTSLRDAAAVVTLAAESRVGPGTVASLSGDLSTVKAAAARRGYSTQEAAWLLLSTHATRPEPGSVTIDGAPLEAPLFRTLSAEALGAGVVVRNDGPETVAVATTVTGTPLAPLPPTQNGLTLERTFHTLDGAEITPDRVEQNTRLLVRLTLTKTTPLPMRLLLTDLLPAGFEVENPRLVESADVAAIPDAQTGQAPEHTEFRDDRFAAAWTLSQGGENRPITVTYMVRAISPGTFTLPAAEVVDMYQPQYVARTGSGFVAVLPTR